MDVVEMAKYLYKKLEERENDLSNALSSGQFRTGSSIKCRWEKYGSLLCSIRNQGPAGVNVDDVEDFISS